MAKKFPESLAADFHGYHCENYEKGVSLVIANNSKSIEKLSNANGLHIIPETWGKAVNSNNRLYNGYDFLRNHPGVVFRKQLTGSALFKKMCMNNGLFRLLWLPFKAVTKVIIKFKCKKAIKSAAKLDNIK